MSNVGLRNRRERKGSVHFLQGASLAGGQAQKNKKGTDGQNQIALVRTSATYRTYLPEIIIEIEWEGQERKNLVAQNELKVGSQGRKR